jgi:hypothetical protein
MKLTIGIEVDGPADFDKVAAAIAALSETQTGPKAEVRRGRPPKEAGTSTTRDGTGPAAGDPLLPEGKGPGAANDALAGIDDDLRTPPPAAPQPVMTYDGFLAEVRKLAAPSDKHNAAVRKRLNELGFEKVKDVPPEKFADTLAELGKVKP